MGSEIEAIEERLNSFLVKLEVECGVFERIVYKNKNQHRRSAYFQYLLKVRRDLRLLHSTKLEELLGSCFLVTNGKKPKQKVHLLESLKWRKCDCGTPNFMERILGAARLLSQMVEPMLKAATIISTLLARSFFMGFSLTILALLARLRVLVQQILLDVVSVFNMVSSLSQEKQSVKITQEGLEVFREYYPTNKEFVTLECVWETDKFVLVEKTHKRDLKGQDESLRGGSVGKSAPRYWTIESFLGDSDSDLENADEDHTVKQRSTHIKKGKNRMLTGPPIISEHGKQVEVGVELGNNEIVLESPDNEQSPKDSLPAIPSSSRSSELSAPKSGSRQAAFVPIKRPAPSTAAFISVKKPATSVSSIQDPRFMEIEDSNTKDSFSDLLTGGNIKDSLF